MSPEPGDPRDRPLRRSDLDPDPLKQFSAWFVEAERRGVAAPEAVALATATPDGKPSLRMVLVKDFDERGLVFHTSYESRKANELDENPQAALLFHWYELGRQVRIEGSVGRLTDRESEEYFRTRPRGGRIAAWASRQSEVIAGRQVLEERFLELERQCEGEVPRPTSWGGFRLVPEAYEFWQHRANRLHDRLRYRRVGNAWVIERLAP